MTGTIPAANELDMTQEKSPYELVSHLSPKETWVMHMIMETIA